MSSIVNWKPLSNIGVTCPRQAFPLSGDVGRTILRWLDWLGNSARQVNGQASSSPLPAGREVNDKDLRFIERHFSGSEAAADFTTTAGKALAARMIQDRHYVKESLIPCNFSWHITSIEIIRPQIIAEILSTVTGESHDEQSIYNLGERIFNINVLFISVTGMENERLIRFLRSGIMSLLKKHL